MSYAASTVSVDTANESASTATTPPEPALEPAQSAKYAARPALLGWSI